MFSISDVWDNPSKTGYEAEDFLSMLDLLQSPRGEPPKNPQSTGWWFQPLYFVNWDDYSQYMEKKQMFQTSNTLITNGLALLILLAKAMIYRT